MPTLALVQKQPEPEAAQKKTKLRWHALLSDLSLLGSLMVARFIVSRTLRRRRQERAARRKRFQLIHGSGHQADMRVVPTLKH